MKRVVASVGGAGLLTALILAAPATALPRNEYIARADQICRPAHVAFKRHFRKTKKAFKKLNKREGSDHAAARLFGKLFGRYGERLRRTTAALHRLPPPPEDAPGIGAWLDGRDTAAGLYIAGGRAAAHGKFKALPLTLIVATETEREAEKDVAGYGFRECAPPARHPQL